MVDEAVQALGMLRGECLMQLKQSRMAIDAFQSAADGLKSQGDLPRVAAARATVALIKACVGPAYKPRSSSDPEGLLVCLLAVAEPLHVTVEVPLIVQRQSDVGQVGSRPVLGRVDDLDPVRRLGWSVVVTGTARTVTDPDRVARCERLLRPWVADTMDTVIAIEPEIVTGFELTEAE